MCNQRNQQTSIYVQQNKHSFFTGHYSNLFQPYPDQYLEDHSSYFTVFHNMTLEKCAYFCLLESRDTCMSFSYSARKQVTTSV